MSVNGILDFAETVQTAEVRQLLDHQIACNMTIAREGMKNPYGGLISARIS